MKIKQFIAGVLAVILLTLGRADLIVNSFTVNSGGGAGPTITADLWQTFSNATLDTTNLAAEDSIADGTWSIVDSATRLSNSTSGQQAFTSTVNSTTDTSTRGLAMDVSGTEQSSIGYVWNTAQTAGPVSFGMWVKTPTSCPGEAVIEFFSTNGNSDYVMKVGIYNDGANLTFRVRGDGSWTDTATISNSTWYRIEIVSQSSSTCTFKLFSAANSQIGSTISVTGYDTTQISFGIGTGPHVAGTGIMYFDNLVAKTNSSAALGP